MEEDQIKVVKFLDKSGNIAGYPATVTKAILDLKSLKTLDLILESLVNKNITIVKDSNLEYHLEIDGSQAGATIDIANTWLDSISYDYNTHKFKFVFTTRQGKTTVYLNANELIHLYYADEETIVLNNDTFSVKPGLYAEAGCLDLAYSALQLIAGYSNNDYMNVGVSVKDGEGDTKSLTIQVEPVIATLSDEESDGLVVASDVKLYITLTILESDCFFDVNDIEYPDISSYFNE